MTQAFGRLRLPLTAEFRLRSQASLICLWWTKWRWDGVFSERFGFPLSVSCQQCYILTFIHMSALTQKDKLAKPANHPQKKNTTAQSVEWK
jgi:hypothetical protein